MKTKEKLAEEIVKILLDCTYYTPLGDEIADREVRRAIFLAIQYNNPQEPTK